VVEFHEWHRERLRGLVLAKARQDLAFQVREVEAVIALLEQSVRERCRIPHVAVSGANGTASTCAPVIEKNRNPRSPAEFM
jgi:hypothetical protein